MARVIAHHGALYGKPRVCRRRRRCDGHLIERHWIEVGELVMPSALPPDDPEVCNAGWLHSWFCVNCWPETGDSR